MPSRRSVGGVKSTIKSAAKTFARNVLGLDVSRAKVGSQNPITSGYRYKWISRFMHFDRILQDIADVDGVIVECGVGAGRSLFDFSVISNAIGRPRHAYGYDTFRGIPDATADDGKWNSNIGGTWNYSQQQVKVNLFTAGLDVESISRIDLVKGELRTTLPRYDAGPIALLHLDVDLYESYKTALELLYDHVATGGVIAFDEYRLDTWPGATKAIDEFFAGMPEQIVGSPVAERYFTIKCG